MEGSTILYFDSGIGGLSVFSEVEKVLPYVNTVYVFDNKYFPYGILSEKTVIERCCKIIEYMTSKFNVDIIVVACNTASTIVLPTLRSRINIPIVGVVPAIKPAAKLSQTKVIGLLATPATVSRNYTDELINNYANDCYVEKIGTSELVKLAELKLRYNRDVCKDVAKCLEQLKNTPNLDVIILGCTHFPWLKQEIEKALPNAKCIDSGAAIAQRVKFLLKDQNVKCNKPYRMAYMTDKAVEDYKEQQDIFRRYGFEGLEGIDE